jgi:uncharacterized protein (DUF849 family)
MSTSPSHNGKVIITCAVTGSIHTPSMSPYLPVTLNDIVDSACAAAEAGAAILHLHAATPKPGAPISGLKPSSRFSDASSRQPRRS